MQERRVHPGSGRRKAPTHPKGRQIDPDALADALLSVLVDRERAGELGRAGAEGVRRHYTVERMAEAAEAVYRAI